MKPATRTVFALVPLGIQLVAVTAALSVISFFIPALVAFLKENEGKFVVHGATRLLVEHTGAAKAVLVGLFAVSLITFLITRSKMKEEADRLAVQSAVYAIVWYVGLIYGGSILMAAALPYFALNQT